MRQRFEDGNIEMVNIVNAFSIVCNVSFFFSLSLMKGEIIRVEISKRVEEFESFV